jgi:cyclic beta-1,2-glucan synthetase
MHRKPICVVLGFYPETATAEESFREIRGVGVGRACLLKPDGTLVGPPALSLRYSALRLAAESLIAVETEPAKVEIVAGRLRQAGAPAVFVLRPLATGISPPILVSEPLGGERLRAFMVDLARQHGKPGEPTADRQRLLERLRESELAIDTARNDLMETARLGHAVTAAAEWLLDNYYLVRTHGSDIRRDLPRRYSRILPTLPFRQGSLRVGEVAQELVHGTDHSLTKANITEALRAYQTVEPLAIAEIWAFPLLLRLALLEALATLATQVSEAQKLREAAYLWANRLAASVRLGPEVFQRILGQMELDGVVLRPHFVICLAEQLQGEEHAFVPVQHWLEEHLQNPFTELVSSEHLGEAAERVSISNAFRSLRKLSQIDFTTVFETVSLVEAELNQDPSGTYGRSDFATRDRYRRVVEDLARGSGLEELQVSRKAVQRAVQGDTPAMRELGYYLLADGFAQFGAAIQARSTLSRRFVRAIRRNATPVYLGSIAALTLGFLSIAIALAWATGMRQPAECILLSALATLPLSELAIQVVNALVISLLPPDKLPRMDFKQGIPAEHAALVVIPMMLANEEVVRRETEKLEVRFLGNQEPNLWFSLFADFTDSDTPSGPSDHVLLQMARDGIDELNQRYPGGRFLLFHRPRAWSESEHCWIGRERKRGKIEELNAFLCGEGPHDILIGGALPLPIRYVIALDADTRLPARAALRMVETIAHPLNQVEIDPITRVRTRGFTIIQPRVSITLPDATATRFTRIFADASGTDPYCQAVSDAQQDLFGEATFHGKAIYDVRAFHTILGRRFPPETLLSHDLIEGAHAGVGLASDIELFESLPLDYASYSQRQHRWIRGDWQIAPWAFARVPSADGVKVANPLSAINRWRVFDNLRRSLVPFASLLLLLAGSLIAKAPGVWGWVVGLAVAIPAIVPVLDRAGRRFVGSVQGWRGALDELARALVTTALLPHQAWLASDAIVRVAYRRWVSHRKMLEWQTAEMIGAQAHSHMSSTLRQLLWVGGLSSVMMIVLRAKGRLGPIDFFVALWIASPALVSWLNIQLATPNKQFFTTEGNIVFLRVLARKTWRFFDDLVSPATHWLPPDNTQLALRVEVAQRTSPTNIGLGLASTLAAFDLGYLTADGFAERCSQTIETMERLERYEGHLLNWYDTQSLAPLMPRYVSTVDSGNLLASLWVLEQGCRDVAGESLLGSTCLLGLTDTLAALTQECEGDSSAAVPLRELRRLFRGGVQGHELICRLRLAVVPMQQLADTRDWQTSPREERAYWVGCLNRELETWIQVVERYLSWMEALTRPPDSFLRSLGESAVKLRQRAVESAPSLNDLVKHSSTPMIALLGMRRTPGLPVQIAAWLEQVAVEYERAQTNAAQTIEKLRTVAANASRIATGIDMRFLYDPQTRLFGIGYAVGGPLEFTSHYDLLASECRLASLVAIAKGDVPIEHWFALGRPRTNSAGGQTLLSWSGGMFEYLMPLLFTRTFANSLLDEACRQAVKLQIRYGQERGVPWGISESAFSALDSTQVYQYRAFGVPKLGLKPGLEDDLVVAPYATLLALLVEPTAAMSNLERLVGVGLASPLGLYEAIDYTRENTREGERGVVVYNHMAHHQGMSLLALDNALVSSAMQRRFHADLRIRSVESLLFERIPLTPPALNEIRTSPQLVKPAFDQEPEQRAWNEETSIPRVYLQGNGRYSLMVTNSGAGYSRYNEFDLTRWRADATRDQWGSYIYIRDLRSENVWSTAYQPVGGSQGTLSVRFAIDRAEFERRAFGIETLTEVTVAPEDDVELRRVTITNRSLRSRQIELTSFSELALTQHNADRAHPAFAKLFVETECLDGRVLLARRRPRSPEEPEVWAAHLIEGETGPIQFETDRREFLGRGNSAASPDALARDLTGSIGVVLDPVFSLRCRLALDLRARHILTFVTLAAPTREALLALIDKYSRAESVARTFEMAWTRGQLEFRYLGIGLAAAQRFQELASHLLYPNPQLRPPADRLVRNRLGQPGLWAYGISGDLPILAVVAVDPRALALIRELLLAHTYWRMRGFRADLVILNQESPSYDRPLRQQLERLIAAHSLHTGTNRPGGVFLKDWYSMPEDDRNLVLAASRVVLYGSRGSLQQQLVPAPELAQPPAFSPTGSTQEEPSPPLPFLELPYFNGIGGFTTDGREYAIYLKPGSMTPAPWVNVMANPGFGTIVSESGLGSTWVGNSQANRLTPWHNDPVSDPQSEVIYLRDEDSGAFWSPTALPIREDDAYRARHGQGYTVFEHNSHAIGQELTVFVPADSTLTVPVKICRLRLRNHSSRPRRLTATYFAEWVLGPEREEQQLHVQTCWDDKCGALLARNAWNGAYAGSIAFAAANPVALSYSGDRAQFLGRNGSFARPAALERARLDNHTGAGLDPAAALQVAVSIEPNGEVEVVFLLGEAENAEEVRALVNRFGNSAQAEAALNATRRAWDDRLSALQVRTPVLSVDFLLNRWLLYQSLSCRIWGRSALYQSSGAFGFRDQLQDSMALLYALPNLTREHILVSAARQFIEGDVQHWWHPETGMGVRTRCSDDLVWLPYVVARYVDVTGDHTILEENVSFIEGALLESGEQEKLFVPTISELKAPLREHCRRALEHAWRLGAHGLPLFGSGDWNDGMNLVGVGGKGESVWLAWFMCSVYKLFAPLMEPQDPTEAAQLRERATTLAQAVEKFCWDGDWYLRGFFDNGEPLGSRIKPEAQVDSLPQSWGVISGSAEPERARHALTSATRLLVREIDRLVLLFTPPFDTYQPSPGYIMGYPPGVRENGGQYTHGSLWLAMAWARLRDGAAAVHLLQLINPVESSRNTEDAARYQGEPYVVAADVSAASGKVGRSGWTWYTGSAGWMYRVWIEEVLGFRLHGDVLTLDPVIPEEWTGFEISFRYRSATYEIAVRRELGNLSIVAEADGCRLTGTQVQLADDGRTHHVTLTLPPQQSAGGLNPREATMSESR